MTLRLGYADRRRVYNEGKHIRDAATGFGLVSRNVNVVGSRAADGQGGDHYRGVDAVHRQLGVRIFIRRVAA